MCPQSSQPINKKSDDCIHDFEYSGKNLICKKCSLKLELSQEIIKKIVVSETEYSENAYKMALEIVSKQEENLFKLLKDVQEQLKNIHRVPEHIDDLQRSVDEKTTALHSTLDELEAEKLKNKKIELEVTEYRNRERNKIDLDVSQILSPFISHISLISNFIQDLDSSLPPKDIEQSISNLKANNDSLLRTLHHSLKNKGVLLNYHNPLNEPQGDWTVRVVEEEKTGKKNLDGKIKKCKTFGCKSKTNSFTEIAEEVIVYTYDKNIDETLPEFTITFDSDTGTPVSKYVVKSGDKIDLSSIKPDDKPHHHFIGWSENSDEAPINGDLIISKDTVLKAIWNPDIFEVQILFVDETEKEIETLTKGVPFGRSKIILPEIRGYVVPPYQEIEITDEIDYENDPLSVKVKCLQKKGTIEVSDNLSVLDSNNTRQKYRNITADDYKIIIIFNDNEEELQKVKLFEYLQKYPQKVKCICDLDETSKKAIILVETDSDETFKIGGTAADNGNSRIEFSTLLTAGKYQLSSPHLLPKGNNLICEYQMHERLLDVTWKIDNVYHRQTKVNYGTTPTAPDRPVKIPHNDTLYYFTKWEPEIGPITKPTTYSACFEQGKSYDIIYDLICKGLSKKEITAMLGISKEYLDSCLSKLESDGKIEIKNNRVMRRQTLDNKEQSD